jgi:iron complex outermembrane receptor protein
VETTIRPLPGVTLDGALSYIDFKYKKLDPGNGSLGALTIDMVTPYTPKWKWSFGAQYDIEEVMGGTVSARFDGSYQSHVYTEAINYDSVPVTAVSGPLPTYYATNRIDGYFLGNARPHLEAAGGKPVERERGSAEPVQQVLLHFAV